MSINRLLELRQDNNTVALEMIQQTSSIDTIRNRLTNGTAPKGG